MSSVWVRSWRGRLAACCPSIKMSAKGGGCLLVVLGATGTGKSKLAIQLAQAFSGEVISADSMQVYRGLDVVTNKVTEEECQGVTHHCLGFLGPMESITVVDFRDRALPIIEGLMNEGKLPVIVGGTHYYIEALLWKVLVTEGEPMAEAIERGPVGALGKLRLLLEEMEFVLSTSKEDILDGKLNVFEELLGEKSENLVSVLGDLLSKLEGTSVREVEELERRSCRAALVLEELHPDHKRLANRRLHARLREVDPDRAQQLHYNDTRKIIRSLEVFVRNGKRHSELLKLQQEVEGGSTLGGPLRYPGRTAVFWIDADQETLDRRLDARVDDMLARGLVAELEEFHANYNLQKLQQDTTSPPYSQGIFQSIGLKEFHSYLMLEDKQSESGQAKLVEGIENLKIATRRYARKQIKWIKRRFLRTPDRQVPPVYKLNGTDPGAWENEVLEPATAAVRHILGLPALEGVPLPEPEPVKDPPRKQTMKERICKICQRVFIGELQWEAHLKSKKHEAMVKKKKRKAEEKTS